MEEISLFDFGNGGSPIFNIGIGDNFLQVIFIASLIATAIFTIIMFIHWKKYAPNPLKVFTYSLIYIIGVIAIIITQASLLSLY